MISIFRTFTCVVRHGERSCLLNAKLLLLRNTVIGYAINTLILINLKIKIMIEFDENDLVNQDYVNTTTKSDNPNYTASLDRERVNKKERYEVIYFCNAFVKAYNVEKTKQSFQKVEKIIRLPKASNIVMRDELNKFVAANWNKI